MQAYNDPMLNSSKEPKTRSLISSSQNDEFRKKIEHWYSNWNVAPMPSRQLDNLLELIQANYVTKEFWSETVKKQHAHLFQQIRDAMPKEQKVNEIARIEFDNGNPKLVRLGFNDALSEVHTILNKLEKGNS